MQKLYFTHLAKVTKQVRVRLDDDASRCCDIITLAGPLRFCRQALKEAHKNALQARSSCGMRDVYQHPANRSS